MTVLLFTIAITRHLGAVAYIRTVISQTISESKNARIIGAKVISQL